MNKKTSKINIKLIFFLILPLLIQLIISSIYTFGAVKDYNRFIDSVKQNNQVNPLIPLNSAYTYWIGGLNNVNSKIFFYYIIFFGAIIPCLYFIPFKKRSRINTKSSYHTCFLVSGFFAFISLLINFISILLFIPAITPDSVYDMYYDVIKGDTLCNIFYSMPVVYQMIYILMIYTLCGLIGCLSYGCYKLFNNHLVAFFIPELFLLIIHITDIRYSFSKSISPIIYCSAAVTSIRNIKQYFIEIGILLFCTIVTFIINKIKESTTLNLFKR